MLKVECESCKAPYQIDERRVPPTGLKMRCPKCGHSFLVTSSGTAPVPAAPPPPAKAAAAKPPAPKPAAAPLNAGPAHAPPPKAAAPPTGAAPPKAAPPKPDPHKQTMVGVGVGVGVGPEAPLEPPPRSSLPSDFPAALGSLEESDLPVVSAGLPTVKAVTPPAPKPPPLPAQAKRPAPAAIDLDLPTLAAELPSAKVKKPSPAPASHLADLPVVAAELPVAVASLPVVAGRTPANARPMPPPVARPRSISEAASLPPPASARGFGEIELPTMGDSAPPPPLPAQSQLPSSPLGSFGEIELPREAPVVVPSVRPPPAQTSGSEDIGDLQFDEKPRSRGSSGNVRRSDPVRAAGGMTFGEVDFGGGDAGGVAPIGVEASDRLAQSPPAPASPAVVEAAPMPVARVAKRERPASPPRKRSIRGLVVAAVLGVLGIAGAGLQLTPYGAFGYLYVNDRLHAADYERATTLALLEAQRVTAVDTYDAAKSANAGAAAAHARTPRAKALALYAAFLDFATTVRFGPDTERPLHGKQFMNGIIPNDGPPPKYLDLALAAQLAANDDLGKAVKALDPAGRLYAGDPIQNEIALLRGNVEYAQKDGTGALASFKRALGLVNDARAHFGLARAYDLVGDPANAKKEIEATLAASPDHPGALTLRARMKSAPVDEALALRDLATVLEGPARAKASPSELSHAYSAKAWVLLERGAASEGRAAFADAVKLNPRNVDALEGEGRLLLNEGRYTEALARFDAALQCDGATPETVAGDAEAKLALERLAEAKKQLVDALQSFPKNIALLVVKGRVEQHLGNNDGAESDLRSAISLVEPARRDAAVPYVALSELLSARGRLGDAKTVLDDARKKLPASAALDRAFGEVAELQGEYEPAMADYRSAIAKAPRDIAAHFRLAVVLRRIRKFDDAGAELDRVAAVDNDYPGLSLERGLLFEESGDVEKAILEFKSALAKAPDDPDLQLRVGSAYVVIGRPDDALPMLRKVLENRATNAEAHHYIGRALMLKGRAEQAEALRYLKRAVDLDPNRAEFHVYLAWAANEAIPAQLELARDEIDKALALDKLNADAYWQKGVLERMEGAIEDAIKDARRALDLRPSRYEAHATLAECFEDRNDAATATTEWARAVAGDSGAVHSDGSVGHPYWHYKYGKLLLEHGNVAAAAAQLVPAAAVAEKAETRPGWLAPLEFLTAEVLRKGGKGKDALDHYRRFLEIAPMTSPDRADAQAALNHLSGGSP